MAGGEGGYLFKAWTTFIDDRLAELRKQRHAIRVRGFVWHQVPTTLFTEHSPGSTNGISPT